MTATDVAPAATTDAARSSVIPPIATSGRLRAVGRSTLYYVGLFGTYVVGALR